MEELHWNYLHFPFFLLTVDIYSSFHTPLFLWIKAVIKEPHTEFSHPRRCSFIRALQPSMIVLLIDWPSLSRLIHLSLYTHCPLTNPTRTNRSTIYAVPRPQREKNEDGLGALHHVATRKRESAEIRSLLANEVKRNILPAPSCAKGQWKRLQSARREKKKKQTQVAFLQEGE